MLQMPPGSSKTKRLRWQLKKVFTRFLLHETVFIPIVHPENSLDNITMTQLKDITSTVSYKKRR